MRALAAVVSIAVVLCGVWYRYSTTPRLSRARSRHAHGHCQSHGHDDGHADDHCPTVTEVCATLRRQEVQRSLAALTSRTAPPTSLLHAAAPDDGKSKAEGGGMGEEGEGLHRDESVMLVCS